MQRQPGEHQTGSPPFRPTTQPCDDALVEDLVVVMEEETGSLRCSEAEILAPELGQLTADTESPEPERRIDAGRHDERGRRRAEADEALHAPMHRRVVDQVVVVHHHDERLGEVDEDVHDGRDERLLVDVRTADELPQRIRRPRKRFADGGDEVGPESRRIRVDLLDLQPGGSLGPPGQPRCQQRRLAGTGRCAGEHQPDVAGEAGIEPIGESRPLHEPVGQRRWRQLRRCQSAVRVPGHGFDPTSWAVRGARRRPNSPG